MIPSIASRTALAVALAAAFPLAAAAQGVVQGARDGEVAGAITGGPIGAAVGSVIGGVVGGVNGAIDGVLGLDARPRFRTYVTTLPPAPTYTIPDPVRPGLVLAEGGPAFAEAPDSYGLGRYRYTVVNGRTVIVDPLTRRVVEVID